MTFDMIFETNTDYRCKISPPSYKSCKTIYKSLRWGTGFYLIVKISLHTSDLWGLWEMFIGKHFEKRWILERFVAFFTYYFVLKMFIAYTYEIMVVQPGG